jgi:cellulose synthase operon protein C
VLAEPAAEAYRKVALIEPLARQLKLKKARLEDALKAYAVASDYGVASVVTAATFHTASLYQDFGRAMLGSQRPKKLSKTEREQYDVMLEEQAFPFEEKAIELHEVNARRAGEGVWDPAVEKSFKALAELRPVRYAKAERSDGGNAAAATANAEGIALRRQGRFRDAQAAYEKATAADPAWPAPVLNLAILADLYLSDRNRALELYERHQALVNPADTATVNTVAKWVADLKNRKPAGPLLSRKDS